MPKVKLLFQLAEFVIFALNAQGRYITASVRAGGKMEDDERGGENRGVNNSVCLRLKAPGGSAAHRGLGQPRLKARLQSVYTHTHTHTHTLIHTCMERERELLPWEPTPL